MSPGTCDLISLRNLIHSWYRCRGSTCQPSCGLADPCKAHGNSNSAYHDCTLWYIPNHQRYRTGGYEVSGHWNYAAPGTCEQITKAVIDRL
jgi:hypothetical protein